MPKKGQRMSEEEKQKRRKALLKHWHRRTDGQKKTRRNLRENTIPEYAVLTGTLTEKLILNICVTSRKSGEQGIHTTMRGNNGTENTLTTNLQLMNTYK